MNWMDFREAKKVVKGSSNGFMKKDFQKLAYPNKTSREERQAAMYEDLESMHTKRREMDYQVGLTWQEL